MLDENKKVRTKLYFTLSIFVFLFFIANFLLGIGILLILKVTPLGYLFNQSLASSTALIIISVYIASTLVATIICYWMIRRFLEPLVELADKSMRVAKGDFSVTIKEKSRLPELKRTLENFNTMVKELNKVETLSNDFITNVSHEFKTPLSVIRSNINILENTSLSDEEKEKCIFLINTAVDKLSNLVSNVLKISRLDNQGIKLEIKDFRLDEQLRLSILSLGEKFDEKNISLNIDLEECVVNNDENLFSQVWENLIYNAIKFTPNGGEIGVSLTKYKNYVLVSIKDNGIGMDDETLKHIFDKFYQSEASHHYEGNGLGLTIVSKIIKLCNARIDVKSKIGEGTEFVVTIPLKKVEKFK